MTQNLRRSGPTLVMVGLLLGAAWAALGIPNFAEAGQFLWGYYPSYGSTLAMVSIAVWAIILLAVVISVNLTLRQVTGAAQLFRRRWARAFLFLGMGTMIFIIGFAHHLSTGYSL